MNTMCGLVLVELHLAPNLAACIDSDLPLLFRALPTTSSQIQKILDLELHALRQQWPCTNLSALQVQKPRHEALHAAFTLRSVLQRVTYMCEQRTCAFDFVLRWQVIITA